MIGLAQVENPISVSQVKLDLLLRAALFQTAAKRVHFWVAQSGLRLHDDILLERIVIRRGYTADLSLTLLVAHGCTYEGTNLV